MVKPTSRLRMDSSRSTRIPLAALTITATFEKLPHTSLVTRWGLGTHSIRRQLCLGRRILTGVVHQQLYQEGRGFFG